MASANTIPRTVRLFYDMKIRKEIMLKEAIKTLEDPKATRQQRRAAIRQGDKFMKKGD